jgi:hypothetical protein
MGNKINVVWKFAKVPHSCTSVASMVDASPLYAHLNIHSELKLIQLGDINAIDCIIWKVLQNIAIPLCDICLMAACVIQCAVCSRISQGWKPRSKEWMPN